MLTCTQVLEKPHCGNCCVPFMNRTILFCWMKSSSAFRNSGFNPGVAVPASKFPAGRRQQSDQVRG